MDAARAQDAGSSIAEAGQEEEQVDGASPRAVKRTASRGAANPKGIRLAQGVLRPVLQAVSERMVRAGEQMLAAEGEAVPAPQQDPDVR